MRIILTLCLAVAAVLSVDAQKKPKVGKAKTLWTNGEYAEAKAILDDATTHEKTKDEGDTWYYRGLLYATLDTTSNEEYAALADNAMETALASFARAEELGDGKGYALVTATSIATLDQQMAGYFNHYYTNAITAYDAEDFMESSKQFELASRILKTDTNSVTNAGYAANAGGDSDRALTFFQKSVERGGKSKGIYGNIINIHLQAGDQEKALEAVRMALETYPDATDFKRQEITILINLGKAEEARDELIKAIEAEPEDSALRFALGLLHEELGNKEEALASYEKALEVNPNDYSSAFNRAVMIFNDANDMYKQKAALGISKADQAKAKKLEPQINAGFKKALPAWEQVYNIQTPERPTLETLLFLYAYLGEEKKADKIEAELDALGDE